MDEEFVSNHAIVRHTCAVVVTLLALHAYAEEGLFKREEIVMPPAVERSISAVVRVYSNLFFNVRVFADRQALDNYEAAHPQARQKQFENEGTLWPVDTTFDSLTKTCAGGTRNQPGNAELCGAFRTANCASHGCAFRTEPLAGSATGFVVGRTTSGDLVVMTAYHVAREGIERCKRTGGVYVARPEAIPDLAVQFNGQSMKRQVILLANASAEDWHNGRDWALLQIQGTAGMATDPLPIAAARPEKGERIWVIGYPTRTDRALPAHAKYLNAAAESRISTGLVVAQPPGTEPRDRDDTFADADGVAGNSGSPAVDASGRVVGLFRAHTFYKDGEDLRIVRFGGDAELTPTPILAQALESITRTK
jgi:S1-C subfamily serine protease